jgi:hypothetical protein
MTLIESANGATATTASEATVNEITSDDLQYWGGAVFIPTTTFTTGDEMEIRFYMWESPATASVQCVYYKKLIGATSYLETAVYIPPVQTKRYRLSFKRTAGTDRTFKWQITKQTG